MHYQYFPKQFFHLPSHKQTGIKETEPGIARATLTYKKVKKLLKRTLERFGKKGSNRFFPLGKCNYILFAKYALETMIYSAGI